MLNIISGLIGSEWYQINISFFLYPSSIPGNPQNYENSISSEQNQEIRLK
jgi:hypothetical protein